MMKRIPCCTTLITLIFLVLQPAVANEAVYDDQNNSTRGWKAGTARILITPDQPVWMAGYASRDSPSEGKIHDLWAKAIVFEDSDHNRAVLVTADILGFPAGMSNNIRDSLYSRYGFERSRIILSSTHTHSGPVLMDALFDIYPIDSSHIAVIEKYSCELEKKIVELTGEALGSMEPANIYSGNGVVRFQVNRRNNDAASLASSTELKGPNDHSVPVIKVACKDDSLKAVIFGYACHTTVLNINMFSGDYAGFAQIELEKQHPRALAMFFQGAGADQNPLPRRTIPLAEQYGKELAAAVERVLKEEMTELKPGLATAYSEIQLEFDSLPGEEYLLEIKSGSTGYQQKWASGQLDLLERDGRLIDSYPYPVQVWRLGNQALVALGGELVIEYAIHLKSIFGNDLFVMGYANDVMGYIPSEVVLEEGNYEGETSLMVYGLPAKWKPGIQERIIGEIRKLAVTAGVPETITNSNID